MVNRYYKYYQPNKLDLKDEYGDCTIRALSKALNVTWLEAFELTLPLCREFQLMPNYMFFSSHAKETGAALGLIYNPISNKKGSKRPTVKEFAKSHPTGRYIVKVAHHVVAVVDGVYYDTWDSGYKSLYGYYEVKGV